jgi:hypothetical protein
MNINDWKELIDFLANKYQQGYISPDEFNRTANMASLMHFERLVGQPEAYQYGRPIPKYGLGFGERITESLRPFTNTNVSKSITSGLIQIPDCYKILSIRNTDGSAVRKIAHEKIHSVIKSSIEKGVFYTDDKNGLRVYVKSVSPSPTNVLVDYLSKPTDVNWAYTIVSDEPAYDAANSINPLWNDNDIVQIIYVQLGLLGIHLKDADMVAVSDKAKIQGE